MPLNLDELEGLQPATGRGSGKIDETELEEMLETGGYSAKDIEEHFGVAHGTANTRLTNLFKAKAVGRVQKGNTYFFSAWRNFSPELQAAFEGQIAEIIATEEQRKKEKAATTKKTKKKG